MIKKKEISNPRPKHKESAKSSQNQVQRIRGIVCEILALAAEILGRSIKDNALVIVEGNIIKGSAIPLKIP